jgi:HSP20 family protein
MRHSLACSLRRAPTGNNLLARVRKELRPGRKAKTNDQEVEVDPRRKESGPGPQWLQGEMDKMFLELMRGERVPRQGKAAFRPNADVYFDSSARAVMIKLELAGIEPAEITLDIEGDVLRIGGTRNDQRHPDAIYQQMEISYGRFERLVLLPPEVDTSKATANYGGGFLTIGLPVRERSASKRIAIMVKDDPAATDAPERDSGRENGDKP